MKTSTRKRTPSRTPIFKISSTKKGRKYWSKSWFYRTAREQRVTVFPLGRNWPDACKRADEIHRFLQAPGVTVSQAKERYGGSPVNRRAKAHGPKVATVGELIEAYAEHAPQLGIKASSLAQYRTCLRRLVRVATADENASLPTLENVDQTPCDVLSEKLVYA